MKGITSFMKDREGEKTLWTLSDGRAYTLIELSDYSGIDRSPMERLLKRMEREGFVVKEQHRFSYYKLSNTSVSNAFERKLKEKMQGIPRIYQKEEPLQEIEYCRSCHGHLAGRIGVQITDKMQEQGFFYPQRKGEEYEFILTERGLHFFKDLGLNIEELRQKSGIFAKACLDFSERKHHLGGRLGVAFLDFMIAKEWMLKKENSRIKIPTEKGITRLYEKLGVTLHRNDLT